MHTQSVLEAQHADGFVDFYTLLAAAPSTPVEELREQINSLYKEAQTDRDHRTPARRREAQLLLELLPQARTILLDAKRKRRYDAYRGAVEMQSPRMPFEEFLPSLLNERETIPATSDILSVARRPSSSSPTEKVEEAQESVALLTEPIPAPVVQESQVARLVPAKSQLPFSPLMGGVATFVGLAATLPTLAAMPLVVCAPLAVGGAAVVGYVFSLTGEVELEAA